MSGQQLHLPAPLVMTLTEVKPKAGKVFEDANLRNEWYLACAACGLGTRRLVKPENEDRFAWYKYRGLLVHDLRRSAVRNLVNAGVSEELTWQYPAIKQGLCSTASTSFRLMM